VSIRASFRASALPASVLAVALGSFACRASGPPAYSVRSGLGIVRAHDGAAARAFDALSRRALPAVRAALTGLVERPLELWILPELADGGAHGLTWPDRIELTSRTPAEGQLFILAHELVHYSLDDVWRLLPHVLEEGLCDWVAMRVDPERGVLRRSEHVILIATAAAGGLRLADGTRTWRFRADVARGELPELASVLELPDDELADLQDERAAALIYAVGYLYAQRIGPEHLRELCRAARTFGHAEVPRHWLHDAARIRPEDPKSWARAARELLGPAERTYVLRTALERGVTIREPASER